MTIFTDWTPPIAPGASTASRAESGGGVMATISELKRRIDDIPEPYRKLAMEDLKFALHDLVHRDQQRAEILDALEESVERLELGATEWLMEVSQ